MEMQPKVFVVVLDYNGGELLENCLKSLFETDYPNFSVIVVDNASADGSLAMVKEKFPRSETLRNEKNLGFSGGNNIGIRHALERGAEYVLLLNQDTEVEPDFLAKLVAEGEKDEKIGVLSPLIFWKRTEEVWFSGGRINRFNMKSRHEKEVRRGAAYATGFITGCSMLVKKEVFERIGLLDDNFFLYWEDADFSFRAARAGFSNRVVPESVIYHFEESQAPSGMKLYWLVFSGLNFFSRNCSGFFKIWFYVYYKLRKIKNILDLTFCPGDNARTVRKAYDDFDGRKR